MGVLVRPLPAGRYRLRCKEETFFSAATNGHSAFWPEAEAESDGKWVRVIGEGREVFACIGTYAALNVASEQLPDDPGA